jgi:hypothetical protein
MAFITSTTQPIGGALGDEWFDPSTNRIYKLVPLNGTNVTWKEYNLPSLNPVTFIPVYATSPISITQMLVIAGGGGGSQQGAGGGAGGLLYYGSTVSPSKAPNGSSLSLGTSANIVVIIGAGGAGGESAGAPGQGINGSNTTVSIFSPFSPSVSTLANSFTAVGGGAGGRFGGPPNINLNGGSGGGGGGTGPGIGYAYPGQGNPGGFGAWTGGDGTALGGGGGGGAGQLGASPPVNPTSNHAYQNYGGAGVPYDITGSNVWYAGGGGGGGVPPYSEGGGEGGRGGGGGGIYSQADGSGGGYATGRYANATNILAGTYKTWGPGAQNLGGGGGGGIGTTAIPLYPALSTSYYGGSGGSGVVIIRANTSTATYSANVSVSSVGGETVYTFNGSGVLSLTGTQLPINLPVSTPVTTSSTVVYPTSPYYLPPAVSVPATLSSVRFLAVGGGGGSNYNAGSAGGGGGVLTSNTLAVSVNTPYAITIGGGGALGGSDPSSGTAGTPTTIIGGALSLTALGGGAGRGAVAPYSAPVHNGGSGGGTPGESSPFGSATNYPSPSALFYTPTGAQGYPGVAGAGSSATRAAGGGGGAGGIGTAPGAAGYSPDGGIGINLDIEGAPKYYAGGGGGSSHLANGPGLGGLGGGGKGGVGPGGPSTDGWTNYGGGGGGGAGYGGSGTNGGSGIVVFAHPIAFANATVTGSNTLVSNTLGNTIYRFFSPGTITFN